MEKTVTLAQTYKDYMIALRREFHQNPEASGEEYNTSRRVAEELKVMGLSPNIVCKTGVAVDIEGTGTGKGKTVALRADMDALSVQEINDVPYKSKVDGLMHACGHDGHTASLLGAARILSECRDQFSGVVRLLFQPAEEIAVGAPAMIEAGLLDGVDGTLGIHLWSGVKSGTISVEAGPRMAAANIFKYKIIGKPGHGALPHEGVDAGLAASAIVLNLQSLVSREFTALAPLVITVGRIESGTRWNVIASEATIEGTVRCFDPDIFRQVPDVMWRVIRDTAAGRGGRRARHHAALRQPGGHLSVCGRRCKKAVRRAGRGALPAPDGRRGLLLHDGKGARFPHRLCGHRQPRKGQRRSPSRRKLPD